MTDKPESNDLGPIFRQIDELSRLVHEFQDALGPMALMGDVSLEELGQRYFTVCDLFKSCRSSLEDILGPHCWTASPPEGLDRLKQRCSDALAAKSAQQLTEVSRATFLEIAKCLERYLFVHPSSVFRSAGEAALNSAMQDCRRLSETFCASAATLPTPEKIAPLIDTWRLSNEVHRAQECDFWRPVSLQLADLIQLAEFLKPQDSDLTSQSHSPPRGEIHAVTLAETEPDVVGVPVATPDVHETTSLVQICKPQPPVELAVSSAQTATASSEAMDTSIESGHEFLGLSLTSKGKPTPPPTQSLTHDHSTLHDISNATCDGQKSQALYASDIERAAWKSLLDDKASLAYHILITGSRILPDESRLPSALAELVILEAAVVQSPQLASERHAQLAFDFEMWAEASKSKDTVFAAKLIAMAVSLRPALLSARSGAATLLSPLPRLDAIWPAIERIRRAIVDFAESRITVEPAAFSGAKEHADWAQRLESSREELDVWLRGEASGKVIFAATTQVWHDWLKPDGSIGAIVRQIVAGTAISSDEIAAWLAKWSSPIHVDRALALTDRHLRKMNAKRRPIDGRAITSIRNKVAEVVERVAAWSVLRQSEPGKLANYIDNKVHSCRTEVLAALADAEKQRLTLVGVSESEPLAFAINIVPRYLRRLAALFHDSSGCIPRGFIYEDEYDAALCLVAESDNTMDDQARLQMLCSTALNPRPLLEVFASHLQLGHHQKAQVLLTRFMADNADDKQINDLLRQIDDSRNRHRVELTKAIESAERSVDEAVRFDLLTESDRSRHMSQIERARRERDEVADATAPRAYLDEIKKEIAAQKSLRLEELRQEVDQIQIKDHQSGDCDRIRNVLAMGDYVTAAEYIDIVKSGESLSIQEHPHKPSFDEFFPGFINDCESLFNESKSSIDLAFVDSIKARKSVGPISVGEMSEPRLRDAVNIAEAWRTLKNNADQPNIQRAVHRLFVALGIQEAQVTMVNFRSAGQDWVAKLETRQIHDADTCIIPRFGSNAGGKYAVYGIHRRPNASELAAKVEKASAQMPTIVLYFGRMSVRERRALAQHRSQVERSFLTVDEILIAFLISQAANRLASFFSCTLPFTSSQPYTTTASSVPEEMFFGREEEFEAIFRADGTNLVYGGRQLGKSVLLREVAKRRHSPEQCVVRWIDLKNRGIGVSKTPADLWSVIGDELHAVGVLDRATATPERIADKVRVWLDASAGRRIVLLLDEADAFLDQDSKPHHVGSQAFPIVSQLKGLMDDTHRNFKVVFAGLHNVQRAARDPNTPVAHLGTPVNIGPMLEQGQWRKAQALIEKPLQQMGYRLESPELSMRILSHTNFYPSLIQVFCRHLEPRDKTGIGVVGIFVSR